MATPLPLDKRIELAEAFIELAWVRYKMIQPGRGFDSERQAAERRAAEMAGIDAMLDRMLPMYDQRTLEAVS